MANMHFAHHLDQIMRELELGNQTLARLIDAEKIDTWRSSIIAWRKGREMARESAVNVIRGLRAAGWDGGLDDLIIERPKKPASPESLVLLEERVGAVETELRVLVVEFRELRAFLQSPGAAPRSSTLPRQPNVEDQ